MRITPVDVRSLPPDALVGLRRRAVTAVSSGMSQVQVARVLGVSRKTVGAWVRGYRDQGEAALGSRKRGRRPGEQLALTGEQQSWLAKTIMNSAPDEVGLSHRLWHRQAVVELINREFQICLSTATVGKYLHRWALLPDCALRPPSDGGGTIPRPRLAPGGQRRVVVRTFWFAREALGGNVLVAVSLHRSVAFMTSMEPFDGVHVRDFAARLRSRPGMVVTLLICQWPLEHLDTLTAWLADDPDVELAGAHR